MTFSSAKRRLSAEENQDVDDEGEEGEGDEEETGPASEEGEGDEEEEVVSSPQKKRKYVSDVIASGGKVGRSPSGDLVVSDGKSGTAPAVSSSTPPAVSTAGCKVISPLANPRLVGRLLLVEFVLPVRYADQPYSVLNIFGTLLRMNVNQLLDRMSHDRGMHSYRRQWETLYGPLFPTLRSIPRDETTSILMPVMMKILSVANAVELVCLEPLLTPEALGLLIKFQEVEKKKSKSESKLESKSETKVEAKVGVRNYGIGLSMFWHLACRHATQLDLDAKKELYQRIKDNDTFSAPAKKRVADLIAELRLLMSSTQSAIKKLRPSPPPRTSSKPKIVA